MAMIDLYRNEIELTFAPKMVVFGSADETVEGSNESSQPTSTSAGSASNVDIEPKIPGIALFGLGIALAVWFGRRRLAARRES